jgi:hypothetical protein
MVHFITRRLSRLSVGRKLLVIYLLDLSAVIFISGILINEKFIAIDFGRKEMAGAAYIDRMRTALLATAGWHGADPAPPQALEQLEQQYGEGLQSAEISQRFRAALASAAQTGPAGLEAAKRAALEQGRALVTRIGNQSNLILDPDLDSYYTMSLVLLRFPELLELGSDMAARLHAPGASGLAATEARTQYFILEGRIDAIAASIKSDYAEAFAAAKGPLQACWSRATAATTAEAAAVSWRSMRPNRRCSPNSTAHGPAPSASSTPCSPRESTVSSRACGCTWARRCSCC